MLTKTAEQADPNSCLNKAADDEPVFVLRAKDATAPKVISDWCARRIEAGKNVHSDAQITDALGVAAARVSRCTYRRVQCVWRVRGTEHWLHLRYRAVEQPRQPVCAAMSALSSCVSLSVSLFIFCVLLSSLRLSHLPPASRLCPLLAPHSVHRKKKWTAWHELLLACCYSYS